MLRQEYEISWQRDSEVPLRTRRERASVKQRHSDGNVPFLSRIKQKTIAQRGSGCPNQMHCRVSKHNYILRHLRDLNPQGKAELSAEFLFIPGIKHGNNLQEGI
jgi:hypothetical protein